MYSLYRIIDKKNTHYKYKYLKIKLPNILNIISVAVLQKIYVIVTRDVFRS